MCPIFLQSTTESVDTTTVNSTVSSLKDISAASIDEFLQKFIEGAVEFTISIIIAAIVFYIGKFIIYRAHKLVEKILQKRQAEQSLTTFILSLTKIVMMFVLIIIVIGILGIETSSFLALFASAGVAVGMALSGTLQNFAGGVLILLLKPYKVGDFIEAQGYSGTVKEIQIFHTVINTPDNKQILIPNGGLSTGSINNASRESHRRVDWTVSISYGNDVDKAKEILLSFLNKDTRVLQTDGKTPVVLVNVLNSSSVDLAVRAWVKSADYWGVYHSFNERVYKELPSHGLSFPYPHMDVRITQEKN
ncbi:MAG: mechanosensitive ion channel [Muribaculaceae bacterium]|nr:mechanosensitive ion channel [Muribaculaceae bacterium]